MNLKQRIQAFVSQHQTTGWIVLLMLSGLLLQGILFIVLAAVTGSSEACPPGQIGENAPLYCRIIQQLVLPPGGKTFLFQPWSIITYPFFVAKFEILRVLFDGIIIWAFGRIHQQIMGDSRTRRLSILTVPVTAIITVIICSLIPAMQAGPPVIWSYCFDDYSHGVCHHPCAGLLYSIVALWKSEDYLGRARSTGALSGFCWSYCRRYSRGSGSHRRVCTCVPPEKRHRSN